VVFVWSPQTPEGADCKGLIINCLWGFARFSRVTSARSIEFFKGRAELLFFKESPAFFDEQIVIALGEGRTVAKEEEKEDE
jgi:hypothetical protein